jgi:hypothetical protein
MICSQEAVFVVAYVVAASGHPILLFSAYGTCTLLYVRMIYTVGTHSWLQITPRASRAFRPHVSIYAGYRTLLIRMIRTIEKLVDFLFLSSLFSSLFIKIGTQLLVLSRVKCSSSSLGPLH